jgi:hypothetical protein
MDIQKIKKDATQMAYGMGWGPASAGEAFIELVLGMQEAIKAMDKLTTDQGKRIAELEQQRMDVGEVIEESKSLNRLIQGMADKVQAREEQQAEAERMAAKEAS